MEIHSNPVKITGYLVKTYLVLMAFAFLIQNVIGCQDSPVGIADSSIIPDNRFTASSQFDSRYAPANARLNGAARGWGPRTNGANEYLQIDLGQVFVICAVATQGCNGLSEWTKQYKISTSVDNSIWTIYKTGGTDKLFPGNTDMNTVVKNVLDYPAQLRYIRFIPTTYYNHKMLRVEAYGLRRGFSCSSLPVGVGVVSDIIMTSSSSYNSTTSPSKARLNYTAGSSWCAATSDSSPYLQINLGSPYIICGIATQGDHMTDQWVQSYNMLSSNDSSTFSNYTEKSQAKSFIGNFDSSTAVKNLLYDGTVGQYIRVAPTSHYGSTNCMRTELYGIKQTGGCTSLYVGLSDSSIIPDHRFTASSSFGSGYEPSYARLGANNKAWAPSTSNGGDWLQIDIGSVVFVCAVATQGAGALSSREWPRTYKIRVSLDNVNWNYYQENNVDKIFTGNTDSNTVVTNSLRRPTKAKFIRFYPLGSGFYPSMRAEVYGILSACNSPVGLEVPGVIQSSSMTSSSHLDNTHTASHGRLYGNSAWCSSTSSNTEYIQINLTQVMTVTSIATQGDHTMDKWVTNYNISYSMNGNLWDTYKAGSNSDKTFQGNSDKENIRVQWLSHPVTARHVRVTPQTWNTSICMRIELYGCDYATRPVISGLSNQNLTASSNSYVDLVCIVQEPLIQYIKWYTGNTDITSHSTGLVSGANGVKQSTLRVNYTSADDVLNTYECKKMECRKAFVCKAMYEDTNNNADGIKSAGVAVKLDYPTTLSAPTVHNIKSTSVTVRWIQPALKASHARVTSYMLQYQNSTHTLTINVPAPAVSHVIDGLAIYTNYSVKIKAISRVGPGQWSADRNVRTDSAIPVGTPNSVAARALTSQSIRVTWQKPISGINGALLGYKVIYGSGSNDVVDVQAGQTSCDINNLQIWTVYRITVKCYNNKGDGPPSEETVVRTKEDAPGQPEGFAVTVLNSTGVRLSWALPTTRNGIIRKFKLRYDKTGSPSSIKEFQGNTTLSYIQTGLDKCTLYSFRILAHTIKDGPYTSEIQKNTAEDAPSTPLHLVINFIKPSGPSVPQVSLTWQKPTVCGDKVRNYKVSYNHGEDPNLKVEIVDKSILTVTIPVWGGVTYEFRVRGVTNKDGPDTATKTIVIPIYAPSVPPSNLTFDDVNKTTFRVMWAEIPRSKSNGPVVTYEVNQTFVRGARARRSIDAVRQVKMINSSCCSLYLYDLLVCAEYHISIKGYTSAGAGPSGDIKSLKTSVSGRPEGLIVQATKKREISLTWQKPDSVTEAIESYVIVYEGRKDYNTSFVHTGSLSASSTSKEIPNLYPGTRYTFRVSATTACGKGDNSLPSSGTTKVDAPPTPVVGFVGNITTEMYNITMWESSDINGQIKAYQIIVVKVDETCSFDETKLKSYEEAEKENLHYYIAAQIKANTGKTFPRFFTLGDEKEYNGYKNAKMKTGKTNVLQRALTQDENEENLIGKSVLIARGAVLQNKESSPSGQHLPTSDKTCIDSSIFAVSLAFNVVFLLFIVLLAVYITKLRKQLGETKKAEKRPETTSKQDVYENENTDNGEEGLQMAPLPAQTSSTYEQIDSHGKVDPSDVQTEVIGHHTTPTDKGSRECYESFNEANQSRPKPKPKPKQQVYETVQPGSQAPHPQELQSGTASSSQSTYQSLMKENRTKPVYESLHTYGNTKINKGPTNEYEI